MRGGAKPELRKVAKGDTLVEQGDAGVEVYLLLNGVLSVDVDGEVVAELGPGAIVGELAALGERPAGPRPCGADELQRRRGAGQPAGARGAVRAERGTPERGRLDSGVRATATSSPWRSTLAFVPM